MSKWNKCELGDALTFQRGYDLPSRLRVKGCYPIVSSNGISDYHNEFKIQGPGIVTGRYGTIGEIFYIKDKFWPLNTSLFVKDFKNNNVRFLYYLLYTIDIKGLNAAGAVPGVNRNHLHKIKISIPSLPIQRRIASILSAYDDLIENNLKRIKLLEEIAQRTYEEWFVKFRVNGEQLPINEKTGLPVRWERKKLNDVVNIVSGFPFKSSEYVDDGQFKIVTIKNVQDGYFVPITTDTLVQIPQKVKKEQVLETGDIILSLTGNVGRVCLVYGDNYLLNQRVAKLIPNEKSSLGFIYFTMRNDKMITTLENISNGAAQQNLSPINMGNVEVVYPDEITVTKFNKLSDTVVMQICQLYMLNQKLKQSRDTLLPKLMNGSINVESL